MKYDRTTVPVVVVSQSHELSGGTPGATLLSGDETFCCTSCNDFLE